MHRIHLLVGNQDDVEDPAVAFALDEAAAVDDPAHPAALRDDAVVDRIVLLVVPVRTDVNLLPDARIHPLVVVGMDDTAEAVLRVGIAQYVERRFSIGLVGRIDGIAHRGGAMPRRRPDGH